MKLFLFSYFICYVVLDKSLLKKPSTSYFMALYVFELLHGLHDHHILRKQFKKVVFHPSLEEAQKLAAKDFEDVECILSGNEEVLAFLRKFAPIRKNYYNPELIEDFCVENPVTQEDKNKALVTQLFFCDSYLHAFMNPAYLYTLDDITLFWLFQKTSFKKVEDFKKDFPGLPLLTNEYLREQTGREGEPIQPIIDWLKNPEKDMPTIREDLLQELKWQRTIEYNHKTKKYEVTNVNKTRIPLRPRDIPEVQISRITESF